MGYESYDLKIQILDDIDLSQVIDIFLNRGYVALNMDLLEKENESGIIEAQINYGKISLRTAKANSAGIFTEIAEDLQFLNNSFKLEIFDPQLKSQISLEHFKKVSENFGLLRAIFREQYPSAKYPVRCADVFKSIRE